MNGRRRLARMVAPALVAVNVPTGTDHVVFRFHGYSDYPALLALSGLALAMAAAARRARGTPGGTARLTKRRVPPKASESNKLIETDGWSHYSQPVSTQATLRS